MATIVVALVCIGFFGAMYLMTRGACAGLDLDRKPSALVEVTTRAPDHGHCALCNAPLARATTSDQIVFDLERRIADDVLAVGRLLRQPGEDLDRLYQA